MGAHVNSDGDSSSGCGTSGDCGGRRWGDAGTENEQDDELAIVVAFRLALRRVVAARPLAAVPHRSATRTRRTIQRNVPGGAVGVDVSDGIRLHPGPGPDLGLSADFSSLVWRTICRRSDDDCMLCRHGGREGGRSNFLNARKGNSGDHDRSPTATTATTSISWPCRVASLLQEVQSAIRIAAGVAAAGARSAWALTQIALAAPAVEAARRAREQLPAEVSGCDIYCNTTTSALRQGSS